MTFLLILIAYAGLMIAYGATVSRRVNHSSDFFVAGRGLSAGLVFSTLLAANIGAGSTVGAAGLGYRDGLSAWWWVGAAGIGSMVLAFTVGPKIWRVARENNLLTVGDFLEQRYDRRLRGLIAVIICAGSLSILAGQLIAVAWILNVVSGTSKPLGCLIAGSVITAYFSFGGLHAAARVNVVQLVVKLSGFALALLYLLNAGHGIDQVRAGAASVVGPDQTDAYFGFVGSLPSAVRYLVILGPSFVISPGLLQKVFAARDERAARLGVGANAVALLMYAIVPVLMGIVARGRFPYLANHELALPTLLVQSLPTALGALLLAAIFSAELSAADAVLFMLSTSLSKDLYKSFVRPAASDTQLVRFARISAVGCGISGALLAMLIPTVIGALTIFYSLLTTALLLPLTAGLYSKRLTSNGAMLVTIVSVGTTLLVEVLTRGNGAYGLPPAALGILAGGVVMLVVSAARIEESPGV